MWRHYVYLHYSGTADAPFYVGKGSHRARDKRQSHERAFARDRRSAAWRSASAALRVEIVASCRTDDEAQRLETELISFYGRRDIGLGRLVNVTDGGDGHAGIVASAELRRKRSENARGSRSDAWVKSIRVSRKGGGNGGVVRLGDRLPEAWRANVAAGKVGEANPWFGKPSPVSKGVVNCATGAVYASIARAAVAEGVNAKTLYQYLDGTRPNRTSLARL